MRCCLLEAKVKRQLRRTRYVTSGFLSYRILDTNSNLLAPRGSSVGHDAIVLVVPRIGPTDDDLIYRSLRPTSSMD